MFRKTMYLSLLSVGLFSGVFVAYFCVVTKTDIQRYVMSVKKKGAAPTSQQFASTYQKRTGVRKEIWFTQQDNSRLHYRLDSDSSVLSLHPGDKKMEIVENLQGIKCWMQDKLYHAETAAQPMQQIRFLEANEGVYTYRTQEFVAQKVALSFSRLTGHSLPASYEAHRTAFLKGIAEDVTFSLSGKIPQFQAQHFKATLKREKENENNSS